MYYLGVDLGATNVRAVVGDESAAFLGSARAATPAGPTGAAIADAVVDIVREACTDASVKPTAIAGAGIASMGQLDADAGVARLAANLNDDLGPIPLVDWLSELLEDCDVTLLSDTRAGAIGEWTRAGDVDTFVYLTISSGIGAGVIADGAPFAGWHGNAGEVGHTTIDADGFMTCGCGSAGHWEAYCSGNNLPRFARALYECEPIETSLPVDDDGFAAEDVFEAAGADAFADRVIGRVADLNVLGVANVVNAFAPEVVCIGGAVAVNNPERVVAPIRSRLPDEVVVHVPEVVESDLGDRAAMTGALVSARSGNHDS